MKIRTNNTYARAVRMFTDREEPRAAFWNMYHTVKEEMQQESNIHILNFYGIGGIGKSSLVKKIMSEMDERISLPRYLYMDLNICQESRAVLDRIKNKLAESYKFTFPLFELASYVYAKKVGEKADPVEIKQLTDKSALLGMIISVAGDIPLVGIAAKVLMAADQGVALFRTYLKNHSKEIKQIEYMEPEDIYKKLPYFFALDMTYNLTKQSDEPLVLFLDTYEMLVNELSSLGEPLKADEWIRGDDGLVQNIPNVLWVISGREKLKWERFNPEWREAVDSHILGNLSLADSVAFLGNEGIADLELREQLYTLTNGTPVYLDLCVDQYHSIKESGKEPDISMFGNNTFDLIERFMRYMNETQKDLVYMLACLNMWDDKLIAEIAPSILSNFSITSYEKAKGYSFIIASNDGCYNIHQTVGDVLRKDCPTIVRKKVGQILVEKFSDVTEKNQVFSPEFATALVYITQAALLLHDNRDDLNAFYQEKINKKLRKLSKAGRFEQAKPIFDMLFEKAEQNTSDLLYASVVLDKADLANLMGEYNTAKEFIEIALELFTKALGEDHPDTLSAMNNLANTLDDLGEYQKALELKQMLLEKCKAVRGEDHTSTLSAMNNLATTLRILGKYQQALELKQTVLEKRKVVLGEDHPSTVRAMNNLATILGDLGQYEKALELYQLVLEKRKANLGEDHPDTISAMNNLANTLDDFGEYQKALELKQTVLEKRKKIFGEDHPSTLSAMNNLAKTLRDLGKHQQALELKQTVLEKRNAILGEDHPSTVRAMNNLANTLDDLGKHQQALELKQTVLERRNAIFGEDHPDTLSAMNNLANTLDDFGEYQKALELKQTVLEKRKKIFGEDHPSTLSAMNNLAKTLRDLGKHQQALELKQTVLEKRNTILGEDHPDTINAMNNLANTLSDLGEYQKAYELYQKVYEKRKVVLGEDHPLTKKSKNLLERMKKRIHTPEE